MNPRLGRCYELSYQFATSHEGYDLVHGYISTKDGSRVIDHAWTERDGTVYDPVMDQELPAEVYRALLNAEEAKRYSGIIAMKHGLESGTYGPWHDIPKGKRKHPDLRESEARNLGPEGRRHERLIRQALRDRQENRQGDEENT